MTITTTIGMRLTINDKDNINNIKSKDNNDDDNKEEVDHYKDDNGDETDQKSITTTTIITINLKTATIMAAN